MSRPPLVAFIWCSRAMCNHGWKAIYKHNVAAAIHFTVSYSAAAKCQGPGGRQSLAQITPSCKMLGE